MRIQRLDNVNTFGGSPVQAAQTAQKTFFQKTAKAFAKMDDAGEGVSIACDFLGKAFVVPAVIMAVSSEPKDKKEYSAFKNPIAAVIQLALEVPVLAAGSKIVGDCANKGMFDIEGSDFSYNEKAKRAEFVDKFEQCLTTQAENSKEFLDEVKSKGYSKKLHEQFDDIVSNLDDSIQAIVKKSFKDYERTYKNQFHLKNRICFAAALILTPLLCAIENRVHPIIMDKILKLQHLDKKSGLIDKFINFDEFVHATKTKKEIKAARVKKGSIE